MNFTRRTVANVLAGLEREFHPLCQQIPNCDEPAKWMIWAFHGVGHTSFCAYSCAGHKDHVLNFWADAVADGETCTCGQEIPEGDRLDRWVKFIRL